MRSTVVILVLLTSAARAESPAPPEVVVDLHFDGEVGIAHPAADPGGAAGTTQVMDMVSGEVTIREIAMGQVVAAASADAFWTAAGITGIPKASAQHAIFDPHSQRWYAIAEEAAGGQPNRIYVASSQSGDATSAWKAIALPAHSAAITDTRFAVDPAGLYLTGESAGHSIVMALPLEDLEWTATTDPTAAHLNTFPVAGTALVPAIDPDDTILGDARTFVARTVLGTNTAIAVYRLRWAGTVLGSQITATLGTPALLDLGSVYANPSRAAVQPSPGPGLGAGTGRLANASATHGMVVGIATIEQFGYLGALWFEASIDPSTDTPPAMIQQGVIADAADLIAPAIAIAPDTSIGMVVVRTSATEPPGVFVTAHGSSDFPGWTRTPVPGRIGGAPYSCDPTGGTSVFGRYSSISSTATGFWAVAQYGASSINCAFSTAWVNFNLSSDGPGPGNGSEGGADAGTGTSKLPTGCVGCTSGGGSPLGTLALVALVAGAIARRRPPLRDGFNS